MLLLFPVFFGPYSFLHTVLHASCSKSELMRKILQKLWHHHHWCCLTPCPSLPEMFFTVPTDLLTITSTSILMGRYIPCWRCPGVEFWRCSFQISSVLRLLPFQFFFGNRFLCLSGGFLQVLFFTIFSPIWHGDPYKKKLLLSSGGVLNVSSSALKMLQSSLVLHCCFQQFLTLSLLSASDQPE